MVTIADELSLDLQHQAVQMQSAKLCKCITKMLADKRYPAKIIAGVHLQDLYTSAEMMSAAKLISSYVAHVYCDVLDGITPFADI